MKTLYVIVHVSYDHYRFQDNIGATDSLAKARKFARKCVKAMPPYLETPIAEGEVASMVLDDSETPRILIESWPKKL